MVTVQDVQGRLGRSLSGLRPPLDARLGFATAAVPWAQHVGSPNLLRGASPERHKFELLTSSQRTAYFNSCQDLICVENPRALGVSGLTDKAAIGTYASHWDTKRVISLDTMTR